MSRARPAVVRCYLDADVLGLAHVVAGLRSDATYPGDPGAIIKRRERPACAIADPATKDDVWILQVASIGWLIITRDSRIQQRRAEIAAVKASNAHGRPVGGRSARDVAATAGHDEALASDRRPRGPGGAVHLHRAAQDAPGRRRWVTLVRP